MPYKTCNHGYCTNAALWTVLYSGGSSSELCDEHAASVKASGRFGLITRNGEPRPDPVDLTAAAPIIEKVRAYFGDRMSSISIRECYIPTRGWVFPLDNKAYIANRDNVLALRARGATVVAFACGSRIADFNIAELV